MGDPQLLADRTTGRLWLLCIFAPPGIGLHNSAPATRAAAAASAVHPRAYWSDDDGIHWSGGRDLTTDWTPADGRGVFASSGHGLQLADGTLLVPYADTIGGGIGIGIGIGGGIASARIALSTDHGRSWHTSGPIATRVSEHHLAQLADGSLVDDARPVPPTGTRRLSLAAAAAGPWTPITPSALPDPGDNADLLAVPAHPGWLLESSTSDPHIRRNLTVHLSRDGGRTWIAWWPVEPGRSGYSSMAILPSGRVGICYETPTGLAWQTHPLP